MKPVAYAGRCRTKWLGLFAACGLALTLMPSAHAQGGKKAVGAVLGVPIQSLASLIAANIFQANVNVVHVSSAAFGNGNTQIATVAISQKNNAFGGGGAGAGGPIFCKIPTIWLPTIKQINNNKTIVEQVAVGNGNTQVATVAVNQDNAAVKPGSRWLLVPGQLLGPLVQINTNLTIVTQIAVGNGNTQIAVVNVDQSNGQGLNVPADSVPALVQINTNLTVITQVAVGDGNTQIATVDVGQSNG